MGSKWTRSTLSDLSSDVSYGYTESASSEEVGPHFLRITDIQNGVVDWSSVPYCPISENDHRKYKLKSGDIVVARTGNSTGENYIFAGENDAVFASYLIRFRISESAAMPKYVWYTMRSAQWWDFVNGSKTGSAQAGANAKVLGRYPVVLPPLPEQKAIAHVLGSLDDKIELNRRMNATLEGMAQTLFKSWFVDFDPVIDNALTAGNPIPEQLAKRAEVRRKALADGPANRKTAKQFPDSFKFTEEMGWIPEGWEVSTIGNEAGIVGGGTPSTKNPDFWEGGEYPWVTPKDFSSLRDKVLLSSSRYLTGQGLSKVSSGLLPIGTVLMSSRAPVGYLAITQIETAINQGFIAMKCDGRLPSEYILQWANSIMDDIKQASSGSTFAEISKKAFRPFRVLVPTSDAIEAYTDIVAPAYGRIADNVDQNETLSSLRDTLLPKLISGELRINA